MVKSVDTDVEVRAQIALQASPIYALRLLNVSHVGGSLVITGRVDTFYYKQMAQEAIRAVASDIQVINQIDVD